jgi:hypothetical protein
MRSGQFIAFKNVLVSLTLGTVVAIAALVLAPGLRAQTDTLYNVSDDSYVSESVRTNLNDYSVSTITLLHIETYGAGSDYSDASSSIVNIPDETEIANAVSGGGESSRAIVDVSDITQNEDGDWIASTVDSSQSGYTYNVDCGSGVVEFDSSADGGYTGEGCSTYGYVSY